MLRSLETGWLTTGPFARQLESEFALYAEAPLALAVSSCTAAMYLALRALGIGEGEGDEVITTPLTWPATANVIVRAGARPVFVDVDPETLCLDPEAVAAAVTPAHPRDHAGALRRAIRPTSPRCERDLRASTGCGSIEDAAHATETRLADGRKIGSVGDITCFSFYANKNLAAGEGGMLTLRDEALAARIASLRLHGLTRDSWKRYEKKGPGAYDVLEPGYKLNLCDLHAGVALGQLHRLDGAPRAARRAGRALRRGPRRPRRASRRSAASSRPAGVHGWHIYVVRIDAAEARAPAATPTPRRSARRASARACTSCRCTTSRTSAPRIRRRRCRSPRQRAPRCSRCRSRRRTRSPTSTMSSRPCAACTRTSRDDPPTRPTRCTVALADRRSRSFSIAAVLWQADLHRIGNALRDTSPGWFCAAIAINIVATFDHGAALVPAAALRAGGASRASGGSSRRTSIALLLGQVLPTAVGGDAVRAIDLARRTGARAEAVSSVLVDRVVGLAALGALAAGGALAGGTGIGRGHGDRARPRRRGRDHGAGRSRALRGALAAAAPPARPARARALRVEAPLRALYHALHAYRGHPGALASSLLLGAVAQGMRAVSIGSSPPGMGLGLGFATLLVLCPVLFLVTIVPASLNGIGLREATFVVVLRGADVGREDAFALGLAFFAVGVIVGALGGVALLRRSLVPGRGRTGGSRPVT